MKRLKAAYTVMLFGLLRALGYTPVESGLLNQAVEAAVNLGVYMKVSGAIHSLWDRNPRALKRIERMCDGVASGLVWGMPEADAQHLRSIIAMASRLSDVLLENQRLQTRVVALEGEHASSLSNRRAAA